MSGTFGACTAMPAEQPWVPQGIDFATVNGTQYAYVASDSNPFTIFQCALNIDGSFNTCSVAYTSPADQAPLEVNIVMQTIPSG